MSISYNFMDCSLSGSSVPEILQDHWWRLPFPSQGVFPHIGMEPRSPALQMDSLLAEPPGKPRAVLVLQNLVESPRELPYAVDASYWLLVSQVTQLVKRKKSICQSRRCWRRGLDPWVRKITWSRKWLPTSVILPGKFHGQGSLVSCSPWGHKESDTAEHAHN